ncbi:6295_t:CDS:2, partial [Gigaspora margarita]
IYSLPSKANSELKKIFVKIIQDQLKAHFKHSGLQRVLMLCTLSQFYDVFKGYIYRRFSKSGKGVKYFANEQRTYVTFQPPCEWALHLKTKEIKPRITQVTVDWYQKVKTDTDRHVIWAGYISFRFLVARGHS